MTPSLFKELLNYTNPPFRKLFILCYHLAINHYEALEFMGFLSIECGFISTGTIVHACVVIIK